MSLSASHLIVLIIFFALAATLGLLLGALLSLLF